MVPVVSKFRQFLLEKKRCCFCDSEYALDLTGTLSCSYHPYAHVNNGVRTIDYSDSVGDPMPSTCTECINQHLDPRHRKTSDHVLCNHTVTLQQRQRNVGGVPMAQGPSQWRLGCTRIDHCEDVYELLAHPYLALPLAFADALALRKSAPASQLVDASQANIIVVSSAKQLEKVLEIDIPATRNVYRRDVSEVYEEMAHHFELPKLADSVLAAQIHNPESSISRLKQLQHRDAARKDRIRQTARVKALFAPFVIIARVAQDSVGSKGMRLRKRQ